MAVPVIASVATGTTAAGTSHTITLPASISSGDRLRVFLGGNNNVGTITWPAGWDMRIDASNGTSERMHAMAERVADGGEGSSISITSTGGANGVAFYSERITGAHASQATEVTALTAIQGSSTINPASITASWGAEDNLFAVATSWYYGDGAGVVSFPSGYGDTQEITDGVVNSASLGYAALGLTADATDDPGVITFTEAGEYSICFTCVLRPAAAGGGGGALQKSSLSLLGVGA